MRFDLDNYFGVHARSLKITGRRTEVLAANLANADTPGYKARDLDFQSALKQAGRGRKLKTTQPGHIGTGGGSTAAGNQLLYRVPMQPSQDGNTVDTQREQAAFSQNAIRYQASLEFLGGRINSLVNAIKGG